MSTKEQLMQELDTLTETQLKALLLFKQNLLFRTKKQQQL